MLRLSSSRPISSARAQCFEEEPHTSRVVARHCLREAAKSAISDRAKFNQRYPADRFHIAPCRTIFDATAEHLRKSRAAGSLPLALPPLRQIFLGQRRSGRLGLHHVARNSPAAGFFDRLNAVDAARDLLAVAVQRVAAP